MELKDKDIVIVGYARSAIGDFLGGLKDVSLIDLSTTVAKAAMERAGVKPEDVSVDSAIFSTDSQIWSVGYNVTTMCMYYNKDILDAAGVEVPTTWDELKAACEAIKAYDDSIYPWGIDMTTDEGQAAFAYYTWNNGGGFVDEDGNWALNSEANVEAIQFAIDLVNDGYTNSDPANDTRYDLQDMFGAGKVAMLIAPNSLPTYITTGGNEVNYGVASIPSNTGESVSAGVMDRFMCFNNDYSDEEKAAITTFFDYFYDDARYTEWVDMEGFLPATKTGGEALAAADEDMASWIDILSSCKFYPTAKAEWADVKQGVIDAEQNALLGSDVQELLDDLLECGANPDGLRLLLAVEDEADEE